MNRRTVEAVATQSVELTVNGEPVRAQVEPRMHLGDFVRRDLGLTGTHLSCEHGVCGACTVLIDGQPQRSCITFAVACAGASITTVEGYGDDLVMAALRRAFHEHHALQCGYCTPGMLCTARDIVLRLPGPDARRVRHELAGNLCRCTGYVGIVEAIDSVLTQKAAGLLPMPASGSLTAWSGDLMPTGSESVASAGAPAQVHSAEASAAPTRPTSQPAPEPMRSSIAVPAIADPWQPIELPSDGDWVDVRQSLSLPLPAEEAWRQLSDLPRVANCLPGAQITAHSGRRATGVMNVKFGPVTARFAMRAELALDDAKRQGQMQAEGVDQRSATRVKTLLDYGVASGGESSSEVSLRLRFRLAGPLAQFSRAGLVNDYVAELTRLFGVNLARTATGDRAETAIPAAQSPSLLRLLWTRVRRALGFS